MPRLNKRKRKFCDGKRQSKKRNFEVRHGVQLPPNRKSSNASAVSVSKSASNGAASNANTANNAIHSSSDACTRTKHGVSQNSSNGSAVSVSKYTSNSVTFSENANSNAIHSPSDAETNQQPAVFHSRSPIVTTSTTCTRSRVIVPPERLDPSFKHATPAEEARWKRRGENMRLKNILASVKAASLEQSERKEARAELNEIKVKLNEAKANLELIESESKRELLGKQRRLEKIDTEKYY